MPLRRKAEDAARLRQKAEEMLRLAKYATMPDVAAELIEMATMLHERAIAAEEFVRQAQSNDNPP